MGASVLLRNDEATDLAVKVVAFVDDKDNLVLLGYDSEEDYEWGVTVNKDQKDLLLQLVRRDFNSDLTFHTFCTALQEVGIPYRLNETTDLEPSGP